MEHAAPRQSPRRGDVARRGSEAAMHYEYIGALEVTYGHALAGGGGFRRVTTPEGNAAELTPATFLWFKLTSNAASSAGSTSLHITPSSPSKAVSLAIVHLHVGGEEAADFPVPAPKRDPKTRSRGGKWMRLDKAIDRARGMYLWYLVVDWRGPSPSLASPKATEIDGTQGEDDAPTEGSRPLKDIRVVRDVKDIPNGYETLTLPLVSESTDAKGNAQVMRSYICFQRLDDEDLSGSTWLLSSQKAGSWVDVRDIASNRWRVGQIVHTNVTECRILVSNWSKQSNSQREEVVTFSSSRNRVAALGTKTTLHLSPAYPHCRKQGLPWNWSLKDLENARIDFDLRFSDNATVSEIVVYTGKRLLPMIEKSVVSQFYSNELAEQVSIFHQHVIKRVVTWYLANEKVIIAESQERSSTEGGGDSQDFGSKFASQVLSIVRLILSGMITPTAGLFFYTKYGGSYSTMKTLHNLLYTSYLTNSESLANIPMRHPCRSTFFVDAVDVFIQAGGLRFILNRVGRRDISLHEIAILSMVLLSAKPCVMTPARRKRSSSSSLSSSTAGKRKSSATAIEALHIEDSFREFLQATLARLRRMSGDELRDEDGLVEHITSVLELLFKDGSILGNEDATATSDMTSTSGVPSPPSQASSVSPSSELSIAEVFEMFQLDLSKKYICCPFLAQRLQGISRITDLITMAQRRDLNHKKSGFNLKRTAAGAVSSLGLSLSSSSGTSTTSSSQDAGATKWLRHKFLIEWLVDSDVVEVVLGQREACAKYGIREGVHLELLKRARPMLEAIAQSGYITETHLTLLWRAAMAQLRSGRKAIFDIMMAVCVDLPADMLEIVMVLLTQVEVAKYDELILEFLQKLIEMATKSAIDADNGTKKSSITSIVVGYAKRAINAQKDAEVAVKISGLGLSLLWNAIESLANDAEKTSAGSAGPGFLNTVATALADSLHQINRLWVASSTTSSSLSASGKEQLHVLSTYLAKCVGVIKSGSAAVETAMVVTQRVIDKQTRAGSSTSVGSAAQSRSTFQSGGTSAADLIKELESKHAVLMTTVIEVERFTKQSMPINQSALEKRLAFLAFLVTSSTELELSYKLLERLWSCLVANDPAGESELGTKDVFFRWIRGIIPDPADFVQRTYAGKHAMSPATTEEVFGDLVKTGKGRVIRLSASTMIPSAFVAFQKLFRYVNVSSKRMSCEPGTTTTPTKLTVEAVDLKGMEMLYEIVAHAGSAEVSDMAIDMLVYLQLHLGSKLVQREVWTEFARDCVTRLARIASSVDEISDGHNEQMRRLLVLLNTFLHQSDQNDAANVGASQTIEELTVYVRTQDGRASAPFYYKLRRTALVGELRDLIARDSGHPADRVRIVNDAKVKLTVSGHDRVTLEKAQLFRSGATIPASSPASSPYLASSSSGVSNGSSKRKHYVEAVLLNRPDSDTVGHVEKPPVASGSSEGASGALGVESSDWESVKFELSSSKCLRVFQQMLGKTESISEEAWKTLKQLNYDSSMEKKMRTLGETLNIDGSIRRNSTQSVDWSSLLAIDCAAQLLYQIELLERYSLTAPSSESDVSNTWSQSFVVLGGREHLEKFVLNMDPAALSTRSGSSLVKVALVRVLHLVEHFLRVGMEARTNDRSSSSDLKELVSRVFQIIQAASTKTSEGSAAMRDANGDVSSLPKYPRPSLHAPGEQPSSDSVVVVRALRVVAVCASVFSSCDGKSSLQLLKMIPDCGSLMMSTLAQSSDKMVRSETFRVVAGLALPSKKGISSERADDEKACRCLFLKWLGEYDGDALHAEYFDLFSQLLQAHVFDEDDAHQSFDFVGASKTLAKRIASFPVPSVSSASSHKVKTKLPPTSTKGQRAEAAPDAVFEKLLSALLTVMKKIPPVLAPGAGRSLREVVITALTDQEGLVQELFVNGLFPANATSSTGSEAGEDELRSAQYYLTQPKCRTDSCRQIAFEVLRELASESSESLRYLFMQMIDHHSLVPPPDPTASVNGTGGMLSYPQPLKKKVRAASATSKAIVPATTSAGGLERGKYVGLKNLGCTCYLNSTVQAFFMIPRLRRQILRSSSKSNGLLYQLQSLFAHLEGSAKAYYNPKAMTLAMKTWDGESIDVNEQQDASEFLTSFFQQMESEMNGAVEAGESGEASAPAQIGYHGLDENILNAFFGGVFSNELVAEGDRYSERFEPFRFISVPVRDRKNLQESLDSWVEGDKVSYTWESPAAPDAESTDGTATDRVDKVTLETHKRISIHKLPDQLIIHLKRFEFDFETMQQTKIHDRFEFPMELDMYPYTKEGQAESRNRAAQAKENTRRKSGVDVTPSTSRRFAPEYYEYELVGSVVHMGTAHSGHYYSFLREHDVSDGPREVEPEWYEFNDTHVTPFNVADLPEECFGGQDEEDKAMAPTQIYAPKNLPKRKKTRSSFMLFYSRKQPKVHQPSSMVSARSSPSRSMSVYALALAFLARLKTRAQGRMAHLRSRCHILAPEPIREQIMLENRMYWRKRYLFNRQYIDFTFQLLSGCMASGTTINDHTVMSFDGPVEVRLEALQLATKYVFGTLWQSGDVSAVVKWKPALCALYRDEVNGSHWLLKTLRDNDALIIELLISNPTTEVRELMAIVLEEAIVTTSHHAAASKASAGSDSTKLPPSYEFVFFLFRLMPWLLTVPVQQHQQYFTVLLGFALSGQNECAFTVVNSVVGAIVAMLSGVAGTQQLLELEFKRVKGRTILKRLELDFIVLKLLSLLIRCGPPPAMDAGREVLLPPSMATNPHAPTVPDSDNDVLLSERFIKLLTQHAGHYTKDTKPLEQIVMHLCWQSRRVTGMFMDTIMRGIETQDHDDVKPYFRTLSTLFKIKDNLLQERVQDGLKQLVAVMASQQRFFKATETSIDMLTRLAKRHQRHVLPWIRIHLSSVAWLEKWLVAHRGPEGSLQQQKTLLVKPNSTSSWATVNVQSDALIRSVDRSVNKLLPRVRNLLNENATAFEAFYDSDDNPSRLVGKRVRVKWAKEKWYEGFVETFDERTYEHLVVYDDGDKRQYHMSDKTFYVVETPRSPGEAKGDRDRSASNTSTQSRRRESSSADM